MALYFFDIGEEISLMRDEHGAVCASDEHAIKVARKTLAAIVAASDQTPSWDHTSVNVRCEDGAHLARVEITVEVQTQNPVMQAVARAQNHKLDGS